MVSRRRFVRSDAGVTFSPGHMGHKGAHSVEHTVCAGTPSGCFFPLTAYRWCRSMLAQPPATSSDASGIEGSASSIQERRAVKVDLSCYFLITGLMEGNGRFGLFRMTELGLVGLMALGAGWGVGKLDNSCFSLLAGGFDGF